MPIVQVDHDPFAVVKTIPVDHDPFANAPSAMSDYAALAAKGASFGLADRLAAGGDVLMSKLGVLPPERGDYAANLEGYRKTISDAEQAHPVGAPAMEIASGMALPFGALGAAAKAASVGGKMLRGALAGTALGAAQGAAGTQDLTDLASTARDTGVGAGLGAGIGMTVPAVAPAVGAMFRFVANRFDAGAPGVSRSAQSILSKLIDQNDATKVMPALGNLGSDAMLLDATPSLTGAAGGLATRPEARSILLDAVARRDAGKNARLGADIDSAIGPSTNPTDILNRVTAQQKAASDPLYAQFRASNIPITDDLSNLLKRPSVRSALPNAERLAQDEGKSIYVPQVGVEDEALPQGSPRPFAPLPDDTAPRPARPTVPRPQTLQDFVKSLGGVQDPRGDLKSMGLDAVPNLIAKPGKGLGPDAVRQAAAEAGYLGANVDEAMSNTDINDLFDKLGQHPVHSVLDAHAGDQWHAYDAARAHYDGSGPGLDGSSRPGRAPPAPLDVDGGPDAMPARQITPEGWDYVKRALDDKIGTAQRSGSNNDARVYTGLKGELTSALDQASPVYAQARKAFADHARLKDALELGEGVYDTGKEAMRPADLIVHLASMTPAEKGMVQSGSRAEIDRQLGTRANDVAKLKSVLQGEGDWNSQKLAAVHGKPAAAQVGSALDRESRFQASNHFIAQNSATAPRTEGAKLFENGAPHVAPFLDTPLLGMNKSGLALAAARKAYDTLANDAARGDVVRRNKEMAALLTMQGVPRDQIVSSVLDALTRRQGYAATSRTIAGSGPLNFGAGLAGGLLNGSTQPLLDARRRRGLLR